MNLEKEEAKEQDNILPPGLDPAIFEAKDYKSDFHKIEIKGSVVMAAVNAFPNHRDILLRMLKERGIEFLFPDNWYMWKEWVGFLFEIQEKLSKVILYEIGKQISESADFPPQIKTVYDVLNSTNVAFHMNARNGKIGYYKLLEFDEDLKYAKMECHNPNPTEFDKGILYGITNKFKPPTSFFVNVTLLKTDQPSREEGGETDFFKIKW